VSWWEIRQISTRARLSNSLMVQEFHAFGMAKIYIQNSQALPIPLHRGVCCTGGTAPEGNAIGKDIT